MCAYHVKSKKYCLTTPRVLSPSLLDLLQKYKLSLQKQEKQAVPSSKSDLSSNLSEPLEFGLNLPNVSHFLNP